MEIVDHIYYGFGKIVLAAITVDGKVSKSEIDTVKKHLDRARKNPEVNLTLVEIVLKDYQKYHTETSKELLERGIHEFHLGDAHLTPAMASEFRSLLLDIVSAEPPITGEEEHLVKEFITYLNERERAANS
ncbi:MAG: hypothetical protein ABJG68_17220 [Crocinitomicaceae bacterium]